LISFARPKSYQEMKGGHMYVLGEPFDIGNALMNPRFVFYALFGYYWNLHEAMATRIL
jgi:hypothetical protein